MLRLFGFLVWSCSSVSFLFGWLDIWCSYFIWVFSNIVWVVRALHNKWYDEERNGDDKLSPNFSVGVSLLPPCPLPPCGKLQNCLRNCLSLSLLSAAHDKLGDYHEDACLHLTGGWKHLSSYSTSGIEMVEYALGWVPIPCLCRCPWIQNKQKHQDL